MIAASTISKISQSKIRSVGKLLTFRAGATAVLVLCGATSPAMHAQVLSTLHSFNGTDGSSPNAALVQAINGKLYGTTFRGGAKRAGTIFEMVPSGDLTSLYSFCSQGLCADGGEPSSQLVQIPSGDLYGTAGGFGSGGAGTIFKVTPKGAFTDIYSFCPIGPACPDGNGPAGGLVRTAGPEFYGTTQAGGAFNGGAFYKVTPAGQETVLYSFCSLGCATGTAPSTLIRASEGDFYGTTAIGGAGAFCNGEACGTIFKITPEGALTTLHSFCSQSGCADGNNPAAGVIEGTDGNLYGTTYIGGSKGQGTVFRLTPSGTFTTIHNFQ